MAHDVTVTFDAHTQQFNFCPYAVRVKKGKKNINFNLETVRGGGSEASYSATNGVVIKNGGSVFATKGHEPTKWQVEDDNKATKETTYEYTVTVEFGGKSFTSPDPIIVNEGGG